MNAWKKSLVSSVLMVSAVPVMAQEEKAPVPAPEMLEEAVRAQTEPLVTEEEAADLLYGYGTPPRVDERPVALVDAVSAQTGETERFCFDPSEPVPGGLNAFSPACGNEAWLPVAFDRMQSNAAIKVHNDRLNALLAHKRDAWMQPGGNDHIEDPAEFLLRGRTILVKDNIETSEWPTTAGSLALAINATDRDAPLIANIRTNGGVILGKTNLSEWANFRSTNSSSGWSVVGGQTRNPFATDRSPCGSSSGSGVAVAAGMSWAAIGTETDGSITCPAAVNGIVGFKPTVGMVSRTHIVPLSVSQDTAGPMTTSVYDAALLLTAMAGSDPLDPATVEADARKGDFTAGLDEATLDGVRIGVLRKQAGDNAQVTALFNAALADMERAGATLVEIDYEPDPAMWRDEYTVLLYEFRRDLDTYLAGSPADIPVRSLADVVAFNTANADKELRWFGQDIMELALETTDTAAYEAARANSFRLAGPEGIDRLMAENDVAFLVAPTLGPAWNIDLVLGDRPGDGIGAGSLAAIAGYPHLTVPMGHVEGLPIGLSIMSGKWHDHAVLTAGAAYELVRSAELAEPSFAPWSPAE